jgi:hypothetical protein
MSLSAPVTDLPLEAFGVIASNVKSGLTINPRLAHAAQDVANYARCVFYSDTVAKGAAKSAEDPTVECDSDEELANHLEAAAAGRRLGPFPWASLVALLLKILGLIPFQPPSA